MIIPAAAATATGAVRAVRGGDIREGTGMGRKSIVSAAVVQEPVRSATGLEKFIREFCAAGRLDRRLIAYNKKPCKLPLTGFSTRAREDSNSRHYGP